MKNLICTCLIIFCIATFGCAQKVWDVDIRDSTQYHLDFLNYWQHVKPYSLSISNDSIVVNNEYEQAIIIPTDLPLNQSIDYQLTKKDTSYLLQVKRVNYTNIEYSIQGTVNKELFFSKQGIAILESSFYLGSEGVYEKSENEIYGMNDYNIELKGVKEIKLLIPTGTIEIIDYIEQQGGSKLYLHLSKIEKE